MTDAPVLAATAWKTNAHLVEDVVRLGYLRDQDAVLDPTYGRGTWWKRWKPERLVTHDLRIDGVDFRALPYSGEFDAAVYDPPYVCVGGRKTTGIPDLHDRYGLADAPKTPQELQALIDAGLSSVARSVRPRGYVLVKCQDYISGGKLWAGTHWTLTHGIEALGLTPIDRLEHIGGVRPQPPGRKQVHARRNLSTLLVFRVPAAGAVGGNR
jgi:hypothetical protein